MCSVKHSITVLEIAGIQEAAIVAFENRFEVEGMYVITLPTDGDENKFLYAKYFNDVHVNVMRNQSSKTIEKRQDWINLTPHFSEEKIDALRKELPNVFAEFMTNAIGKSKFPDRMAFLGLFFDIMRNLHKSGEFSFIASCIWLAMKNGKSGQLHDILLSGISEINHLFHSKCDENENYQRTFGNRLFKAKDMIKT